MQQSETYKRGTTRQSCCQWQEMGKQGHGSDKAMFQSLGNELYTDWYSNALFQLCLVSLNGEWADARQESHTEQDLKPDRMPCVRAVADILARLKVQYEGTFPIYWAAVSTAPVLQGMPHVHCNSRQTRHCNVFQGLLIPQGNLPAWVSDTESRQARNGIHSHADDRTESRSPTEKGMFDFR